MCMCVYVHVCICAAPQADTLSFHHPLYTIQVRLPCDVVTTGYEVFYHPVSQPQSAIIQLVSEIGSDAVEHSGHGATEISPITVALGQTGDLVGSHSSVLERNGDTVTYTLRGLRPYTQYSIRVRVLALGSHSNNTLLVSAYNSEPLEVTTTESGMHTHTHTTELLLDVLLCPSLSSIGRTSKSLRLSRSTSLLCTIPVASRPLRGA